MNVYMGYDELAGPAEGACLVFAATAKEAKKLAYPVLAGWLDTEWVDVRARRMRENIEYFLQQGDPKKLAASEPHVIESPKVCPHCEMWGGGEPTEDGRCDLCYGDDDL